MVAKRILNYQERRLEESDGQEQRKKWNWQCNTITIFMILTLMGFAVKVFYETYSRVSLVQNEEELKFKRCLHEFQKIGCSMTSPISDRCAQLIACMKDFDLQIDELADLFSQELQKNYTLPFVIEIILLLMKLIHGIENLSRAKQKFS